MYSLIRFALFFVFFLLLCLVLPRRKHINKRKRYLIYAALCFALFAISHYYPIENALRTFHTPDEVFHYTNFEKMSYLIDGEESCMIVYPTGKSTYSIDFIGKRDDGYTILPEHGARMVSRKNDENGIIAVYQVEGTADFYIVATFWEYASMIVYNESGMVDTDIVTIDNSGLCYFHVHNLSDSHYLLLDGKKVGIYS